MSRSLFIAIIFIVFSLSAYAQKGPLMNIEIEDILTMAMVESKNILVSFGSSSSEESNFLNEKLLTDVSVNKIIDESLILVSVDMDNIDDFRWFGDYKIVYVPTLAIINPLGDEVDRITGAITTDRIHTFFDRFKEVDQRIFEIEEDEQMLTVASTATYEIDTYKSDLNTTSTTASISTEENVIHSDNTINTIPEVAPNSVKSITNNIIKSKESIIGSTSETVTSTIKDTPISTTVKKADDYIPNYRVIYASEGSEFPIATPLNRNINAPVKKSNKKKSTSSVKKKAPTSHFSADYRIHFGSYSSKQVALEKVAALKKLVEKKISLIETGSEFTVVSRDLISKNEARSFVQKSRAKGIRCYLLNG